MSTLKEDHTDMCRSEFLLVKDVCKECPIASILEYLRSCNWDVDETIHNILKSDNNRHSVGASDDSTAAKPVHSSRRNSPFPTVREGSMAGRVRVIASRDRERKPLPRGFLDVPRFRVTVIRSAPSFVDFCVHLMPPPEEALGLTVMLEPAPPGAAVGANDHRNGLLVESVMPHSLAEEVGLVAGDQLLRVNGILVAVSSAYMEVDDVHDAVSALRRRGEPIVLLCRRVLDLARHASLPFTQEQCFLYYPQQQVSRVGDGARGLEADETEDGRFHPYAQLFFQQEMIDLRRAAALSKLLAGIKEAHIEHWEREFLAYTAQLRRSHPSGGDLASLALLGGGGSRDCAEAEATASPTPSPPRSRLPSTSSRSSNSEASMSLSESAPTDEPEPGWGPSGSGAGSEDFRFKKLEHSVSLPYRQGSVGVAGSGATTPSLPHTVTRTLTPPPSFSPQTTVKLQGTSTDAVAVATVATPAGQSVRFINRSVTDKDIARVSSSADPVVQTLLPHLRPALSVRILRSEVDRRSGTTFYVIWVLDVKTGCEWLVRRRFQDFFELRKVGCFVVCLFGM